MMDEINQKIEEMNELYNETGLTDDVVELIIEINNLQKEELESNDE